jgi:hypothetical protein
MASYCRRTIEDITDFTSFVEDKCDAEHVLFRGQRTDEPLMPRIGRLSFSVSLLEAEQEMFQEFKRQAVPFLQHPPRTSWDWLAVAQHHGMSTRLLDWTLNPLAALWFAVNRPPEKNNDGELLAAVVWVFFAKRSDFVTPSLRSSPFEIARTRVFQPRHVSERIVAQSGSFTVHKYMKSEGRFIPFERNRSYASRLAKLVIPPDSFYSLRYHLDRFNINASSMFPGIDGMCSHIEWQHSLLEDEIAE